MPFTPIDVLFQDLPPLEELTITVDEKVDMMYVGKITSVVGVLGRYFSHPVQDRNELHHEKTNISHMQKQRPRLALRLPGS